MKFLILIIACTTFIFSQEGQVTNVVAQQRTDGSQIVDISYDLLPDEQFPSFTVLPYISTDEGETYELLNINNSMFPNVLGVNVLAGENKTFYWDHVDGYQAISADNIIFKISAYGHVATTLPESFEMVEIPAGEFMGRYYNEDHVYRGDLEYNDGIDSVMTIDYNYELMKYPVTYGQFCEFLIALANEGLIEVPTSNSNVNYDFSPENNPYPIWNKGYYANHIFHVKTYPSHDMRIYTNGENFFVEAGYNDHPISGIQTEGMELFASYYGLRLPTFHEFIKAARGMNDWRYFFDDNEECNAEFFQPRVNTHSSGDTWEGTGQDAYTGTTPVDYYNGTNYNGFQTIDSPSYYGIYDMVGNIRDLVTIDAACYDAYYECPVNEDGIQPVNSIGLATSKPYLKNWSSHHFNTSCATIGIVSKWNWQDDGYYNWPQGFRCARTVNTQQN